MNIQPTQIPSGAKAGTGTPGVEQDRAAGVPGPEQNPDQHGGDAADAGGFAAVLMLLAGVMPPDAKGGGLPASGANVGDALQAKPHGRDPARSQTLPQSGKELPPLPPGVSLTAGEAGRPGADASLRLWRTQTSALSLPTAGADPAARAAQPNTVDVSWLTSVVPGAEGLRSASADSAAAAPPPSAAKLRFDDAVGQRVVWMVEQGVNDARLRVHPEHLGPIEIRVKLDGDAAQVTFHSPHAAVRDALSDAVPRLREMLQDAGLSLSHAGVDTGSGDAGASDGRSTADGDRDVGGDAPAESAAESAAAEQSPTRVAIRRGLIDTFA